MTAPANTTAQEERELVRFFKWLNLPAGQRKFPLPRMFSPPPRETELTVLESLAEEKWGEEGRRWTTALLWLADRGARDALRIVGRCSHCRSWFPRQRRDAKYCSEKCASAARSASPRRRQRTNDRMRFFMRRRRIEQEINGKTRRYLEEKGYSLGRKSGCTGDCPAKLDWWIRPRGAIKKIPVLQNQGTIRVHWSPHEAKITAEGRRKKHARALSQAQKKLRA